MCGRPIFDLNARCKSGTNRPEQGARECVASAIARPGPQRTVLGASVNIGSESGSWFGNSLRLSVVERCAEKRPSGIRASGGNSFGRNFVVTTFGESHGGGVGCVIDGVPPNLPLTEADIQIELDRRKPGQSRITTPRKESDTAEIVSGMSDGVTLGVPLTVLVRNKDQRGQDYTDMEVKYRPSHADATYDFKYGVRAIQGGGRSSARETIGRVAAGAIAKKLLRQIAGTEVLAFVSQVHNEVLEEGTVNFNTLTMDQIESNIVRCPEPEAAERMIKAIDAVRTRGDSCGGVVTCIARGVPKGLGSPVFNKLEAELGRACLSLPATKGFEIGSGFEGAKMTGSEHNDEFYRAEDGEIRTRTNRSGGVQGGISNGEVIYVKVAFKPTSTITTKQKTVTREGEDTELRAKGRHDPCVVPRAVPMVEAMVALVLVDQLMAQFAQCQILPQAKSKPLILESMERQTEAVEAASLRPHV
ncbi:chorismate synthase [Klebsormidium nitens]|uniref:Chorismate synthase n=1 Tax=Klebsormidium nitens TaxID=105231 RepID=A0A1Y1IQF8_KLENI|nr:chorismate synthase [Klebsormidium nitens]|eukprot:GAQ90857.1 chorismate synthase [Klebsormidium nitens]